MRKRLPTGCLTKKGDVWWCQWRHKGKIYGRSLETSVKGDAESLMKTLMASVVNDICSGNFSCRPEDYGQSREKSLIVNNDIPLSLAWQAYLKSQNRPDAGKATLAQYSCQFGAFVRWININHPLVQTVSGVNKVIAREFAAHISSTKGEGTFNKYINLLHLVFLTLNDTLDIPINPWVNIQRKTYVPKGRRDFSATEVETILTKAFGEMLTLCMLGAHSGMRLKDCALLQWNEVDLQDRLIVHCPFKTKRRKPNTLVKLYILDRLYGHLCELKHKASDKYICPELAAMYLRNDSAVAARLQAFFENECGIKIHHDETGSQGRALVEAGFHSFRHYFVTLAKSVKIRSDVLRELVGWSSAEMERIYNHQPTHLLIESVKKMNPKPTATSPIPTFGGSTIDLAAIPDDELMVTCKALMDEIERRRKAS